MPDITESRLAMYEGMIALAWADHQLSSDERNRISALLDDNARLTEAQRADLKRKMDTKISLKDVWSRITDREDRIYLLDIASSIFGKDGNYSEEERAVYEACLKDHLDSFEGESTEEEMRAYAAELREQRARDEIAAKTEATEKFRKALGPLGFLVDWNNFLQRN